MMLRSLRWVTAAALAAMLIAACDNSNFSGSGGKAGTADANKGSGSGGSSSGGSSGGSSGSDRAPPAAKVSVPEGEKTKAKDLLPPGTKIEGCKSENVKIAKCDPKTGEIVGVSPGKTIVHVDTPEGPRDINVTVTPDTGSGSNDGSEGSEGSDGSDGSGSLGSGVDTASGSPDVGSNTDIGSGGSPQNQSIAIDDAAFACDRGQAGLVGKVYQLPEDTNALPNLDAMTPIGQIDAINLNVPARKWEDGFPALPGLIEWFAIKFFGQIDVPEDGAYQFKSASDDGSKIYIDDLLVLNHDGIHAPSEKESGAVTLTKGVHRLAVEWFQGPRVQIALQVFWKRPNAGYEILPAELLKHGSDCTLQKLGTFP